MSRAGDRDVRRTVDVVVTFLEMPEPGRLPAGQPLPGDVRLQRETPPAASALSSSLYRRVGGPWHWTDRLSWNHSDWVEAIDRPDVEVWTARIGEEIAGYFELQRIDDAVDIRYFGLVPEQTGRGLGGPLLERAVRRAWEMGPRRVTVNTCTLDHPAALPNYLARGFVVVRTESQQRRISA